MTKSSSDEDDNKDGGGVYEPPVDENRNFLNVFDSFGDEDDNIRINPFPDDPGRREKFNLKFYFHTSLWCIKRFYEGLKGLHKTF